MQRGRHVYAACVGFVFPFALFFAVINPYAWTSSRGHHPSMGIITVSCKGSVVRQLSECRVSLVFLELCFFSVTFQGKLNGVVGAKLYVSVCFCAAVLPSGVADRGRPALGLWREVTSPGCARGCHLPLPFALSPLVPCTSLLALSPNVVGKS